MIRGSVSPEGIPTIALSVAGGDWAAVVDTGFNGDLELPDVLWESLNPRYVGQAVSSLAGGKLSKRRSFWRIFLSTGG